MRYSQIIDACLADTIGPHGLSAAEISAEMPGVTAALERIRAWRASTEKPFLSLPTQRDDLPEINDVASMFRQRFGRLVVFGTGGSSLGGRALVALSVAQGASPLPVFLEGSDPLAYETMLAQHPVEDTGFLVVSKSGSTSETLMQALLALDRAPPDNFVLITEPGDNPLRRLAAREGIRVLDHDPALGGRFSVMSLVGLIPAVYAGMDGAALRQGASDVLEAALASGSAEACTPGLGAAVAVAFARKGVSIDVVMSYAERLHPFALWYRQLWAESLGKDGLGMTPVAARGPVDQHSQLQLYLHGPHDKFVSVISLDRGNDSPRIDRSLAEAIGMPWLANQSLEELNDALTESTVETLVAHERPVRRIVLPVLDDAALGALMMHFMLETVIAADLLGVDAFDQPAVEHGKNLARARLGGQG